MEKLVEIKNLYKEYPIKTGFFNKQTGAVYAVNGVDLDIYKGETLGLVGESGCGKSTLGRCILSLEKPTRGEIIFNGQNITALKDKDLRNLRRKMQIIFQNPYSSLNPRMSIEDILKEPFIINKKYKDKREIKNRIKELLNLVGLPEKTLTRYSHEFSGGQRQRIVIARALALNPEFIVADEPVSALDVSIQAQIVNLLEDLKKELKLTYLFISHDLGIVRYLSDRIAVMYLGEIVEMAHAEDLYENPRHPYTQILLSAILEPFPEKKKKAVMLEGDLPSATNPPKACKFHTRCPYVMDICKEIHPDFYKTGENHDTKCFLYK